MYRELFAGLDLNGKSVADLACGSGYNSVALLERFPAATVTGFDISQQACDSYRRVVKAEAQRIDLTRGAEGHGSEFDVAMIVGGLHHCVSDLAGTFRTISALLRPGGLLLMYEPSSEFVLEALRKLWYRRDRYFDAESEQALRHDAIAHLAAGSFTPIRCTYSGGPAYFLIYNSLLFRIPVSLKRVLAPPLFACESAYNRLPWKRCFPTFIAQWKKFDTER
ncbi:MAG TPA: class I SAM-dependent methyltransferase [Casimicrobiaceae bacterium]|nr:class I SAM-dependent methyltransferase [Casimicrobiaceae bacterium]